MFLAILNDVEDIPGLSNDKLEARDIAEGETVPHSIPALLVTKIARLQTLCFMESEKTSPSPRKAEPGIESGFDDPAIEIFASECTIEEDGALRIAMIDQTIVELVRHTFPEENEQFGVRYHMHPTRGLLRLPMVRSRDFLD